MLNLFKKPKFENPELEKQSEFTVGNRHCIFDSS